MTIDPVSVSQLTGLIRQLLEDNQLLSDIWVEGEVSRFTPASSGHWYFTLKDAQSQVSCVMFRNSAARQSSMPEDGDLLRVHGRISVYEARGQYQVIADWIQPAAGVGDLYQQLEALRARLLAEGLFDEERKRPVPAFPRRIGVVTSAEAAAFQDILNVLRRRYPLAEVILSHTLVQGADAPGQIVHALRRLTDVGDIDVILVSRGGGSMEDLWCFNDESVARAIASSPVPVVSGVGHEIDYTLADFVADKRSPTPSAAAEQITPDLVELLAHADRLKNQMVRAVTASMDSRRSRLMALDRALRYLSPERDVMQWQMRLDELDNRIRRAWNRYHDRLSERLMARSAALRAASPQAILNRGYAIISRRDTGQTILSAADAPPGTAVAIRLQHDTINARVESERE